jgi:hypothetical protein
MSDPLNFNFPLTLLLQDGDTIVTAAEANAAALTARLPAGFLAATRPLIRQVSDQDAAQKGLAGTAGTLTAEQDAKLATLTASTTNLRETAKKAFKGNDVKLHDEFQVGINKPTSLAAVLQRARIMLASAQKAENAAALQGRGWIAADTTALADAIAALDDTDNVQEDAKVEATGGTGTRNRTANELYDRLLTIQNAANLQWPEINSANDTLRAKFRLGLFPPPRSGGSGKPPTPAPTPTPPTP